MSFDHRELTTCPEDIPEGRAAEALSLDLASLDDEATPFAEAISKAAKAPPAGGITPAEILASASRIKRALAGPARSLMAAEIEADPRLAAYAIALNTSPYRKAPPALSNEPSTIVRNWLDAPGMLDRAGKEIVGALQARYPGYVRDDYMSRKLPPWQREQLAALLKSKGVSVTLEDCRS